MGFFKWLAGLFKKQKPDPIVPPIVTPPTLPPIGGPMAKKALIIGINKYPTMPLAGCVNDAANMANLLMQNYGFSSSDICLLLDGQATTANILSKLDWLVDCKPGDHIVFHYSGHGAQAPTGNHLEPDGMAEVICPVDFDWSPARMIIDKQFVEIFKRIPAGVVFNWASDSCNSGDLDRNIMRKPKTTITGRPCWLSILWDKVCFWKKPTTMTAKTMRPPVHIAIAIGKAKAKGCRFKGMVNGRLDVGFVSGCKSNQTSADTYMDGQPCGALTHFLIKNLKANPTMPLTNLVAAINNDLSRAGFSQQPQAEGARVNKPWLIA